MDKKNKERYSELRNIKEEAVRNINETVRQSLLADKYFGEKKYSEAYNIYKELISSEYNNKRLLKKFADTRKILLDLEYRQRTDNRIVKTNVVFNYLSTNRKYDNFFMVSPIASKIDKRTYVFHNARQYFFRKAEFLNMKASGDLLIQSEIPDRFIWDYENLLKTKDFQNEGISQLFNDYNKLYRAGVPKSEITKALCFKLNYPVLLSLLSILSLSFAWRTRRRGKTPFYFSILTTPVAFLMNISLLFIASIFIQLLMASFAKLGLIILFLLITNIVIAIADFFVFYWEKN